MKESCSSEFYLQLFNKYFCKFMHDSKVIFKSMTGPDKIRQLDLYTEYCVNFYASGLNIKKKLYKPSKASYRNFY